MLWSLKFIYVHICTFTLVDELNMKLHIWFYVLFSVLICVCIYFFLVISEKRWGQKYSILFLSFLNATYFISVIRFGSFGKIVSSLLERRTPVDGQFSDYFCKNYHPDQHSTRQVLSKSSKSVENQYNPCFWIWSTWSTCNWSLWTWYLVKKVDAWALFHLFNHAKA